MKIYSWAPVQETYLHEAEKYRNAKGYMLLTLLAC